MAIFKQDTFIGGISDGSKSGYEGGYADGIGIDFNSDRDKLSLLRKLKKDSGSSVGDLVKWIIEHQGEYWMYGDTGKVYKRDSLGAYTTAKSVSSSHGNGLCIFNDELWYMSDKQIGKASYITTTPIYTDEYFKSKTMEQDQVLINSANTYTTPTSISETATNRQTFVPAVDNITGVLIVIKSRGTGNITLTLHDSGNTVIASKTIANSDLPSGTYVIRFNFDNKSTVTIGNSYHFHVTSTVADATVATGTSSDLETAEFVTLQYYNSLDTDQELDLSGNIYGNTYTTTTSISETSTTKQDVIPVKYMLDAISIYLGYKGTGNWTVTLHDELNKTIGTVTITNANIATRGYQRFTFSSPLTLIPGASYHFHVTTTVADGYVHCSTSSDLNTCGFFTHTPILLDDQKFHQAVEFANFMCIANGRFLAVVEDSELFDSERLIFPKGEIVRSIDVIGDNLAIATVRGTNIADYGDSKIYLWNGVADNWNNFIKIDGQVNALKNDGQNRLAVIHGTTGNISFFTGSLNLARKFKGVGDGKTIEIYPQAIGTWEGLLRLGISDGTSTTIDRVIWSYGKKDKDFKTALSKDYPISTGNKGSTVQIGALLGVSASKFFVSWKDSTSYGVDIIDTSNYQATGYFQSLRIDSEAPNFRKDSTTLSIRCDPIKSNESITIEYRLNNYGNFVTLGTINTVNQIYQSFPFEFCFFEVEFRVTLAGTTTSPSLLSLEMYHDINKKTQLGKILAA